MGIPQIILIIIASLELICNFFLDGTPKPIKEHYYSFGDRVLNNGLLILLLIWGDFFS